MNIKRINCKYTWSAIGFDKWVKDQVKVAKNRGIRTSTAGVTQILMERVIKPNKIELFPKLKKIKIKIQ